MLSKGHGDDPYGGIGAICMMQKDYPDSRQMIAQRQTKPMFNFLKIFKSMSQKFIKAKNNNPRSKSFGKFFAQAIYGEKFIETEDIADFIQQQASVKKSDIVAVLTELGDAMKHYFEMGQKVRIKGFGIFKVGFSSIGVVNKEECTAATISSRRVLFQPESERVVVGQEIGENGKLKQKYVVAKRMIKDVSFEETPDNIMNIKEPTAPSGE